MKYKRLLILVLILLDGIFFGVMGIWAHLAFSQELTLFDRTANTVTLIWDANTEPDLDHYTVYQHHGDTLSVLGTVPAPSLSSHFSLNVRHYYERIGFTLTATDHSGNESGHSNQINAIFSQSDALYGDTNGDAMVDIEDIERIRASFGALPWYVMWDDRKDLNGDQRIDVEDAELARTKLGNR